jgi:hypothetical protein
VKSFAVKSCSTCSRRLENSALLARLRVLMARYFGPVFCRGDATVLSISPSHLPHNTPSARTRAEV